MEAIERLGGSVFGRIPIPQGESRGRAWLRKLFGDDFFAHPRLVEFSNDAAMEYLTELTHSSVLELIGTQITDAGLAHLEELTQLGQLCVENTQVTNAGLEHLKGLTQLHMCCTLNGTPGDRCWIGASQGVDTT